jgi:2-polyprenyl-3-methyl-5-hydroxy-6-metoxy-1,4-benzoquinol methylase
VGVRRPPLGGIVAGDPVTTSTGLRLNLGCGLAADLSDMVVNVDAVALPGVDMIWDLDDHPWPWDDEAFDEVHAIQVFEHLHDPVGFMVDCHRVLGANGLLLITTPHYMSENSFTDPTHVRHCTLRSWDYWIQGRALYAQFNPMYGGVAFEAEYVSRVGEDIQARLRRLL